MYLHRLEPQSVTVLRMQGLLEYEPNWYMCPQDVGVLSGRPQRQSVGHPYRQSAQASAGHQQSSE